MSTGAGLNGAASQWYQWFILLIPAALGISSGAQQIFAKQGVELFSILKTWWGICYWTSRAIAPMAAYAIWYIFQNPPKHSILAATLCGFGAEAVVRAKFYWGSEKSSDGKSTDILKGIFDFVEWWQDLALKKANVQLGVIKNRWMNRLVPPETNFNTLCQRAKAQAASLDDDQREAVIKQVETIHQNFLKEGGEDLPSQDKLDYCRTLGFGLLKIVGQPGVKLLFSKG